MVAGSAVEATRKRWRATGFGAPVGNRRSGLLRFRIAIPAIAAFYAQYPTFTRGTAPRVVEASGCGAGLRACGIQFHRPTILRILVAVTSPGMSSTEPLRISAIRR